MIGAAAETEHRPATGLDSPTSILCLQRPSQVLFAPRQPRTPGSSATWLLDTGPRTGKIVPSMGLSDHRQSIRQAELRVDQLKASL